MTWQQNAQRVIPILQQSINQSPKTAINDTINDIASTQNIPVKIGSVRVVLLYPQQGFVIKIAYNENGLIQNQIEHDRDFTSYELHTLNEATLLYPYEQYEALILVAKYIQSFTEIFDAFCNTYIDKNKPVISSIENLIDNHFEDKHEVFIDILTDYKEIINDQRTYINKGILNNVIKRELRTFFDETFAVNIEDVGLVENDDDLYNYILLDYGQTTTRKINTSNMLKPLQKETL